MIRWAFIFNDDKHISAEIKEEAEDLRIAAAINNPDQLLFVASPGRGAYVNLKFVKAILREEVPHQQSSQEEERAREVTVQQL